MLKKKLTYPVPRTYRWSFTWNWQTANVSFILTSKVTSYATGSCWVKWEGTADSPEHLFSKRRKARNSNHFLETFSLCHVSSSTFGLSSSLYVEDTHDYPSLCARYLSGVGFWFRSSSIVTRLRSARSFGTRRRYVAHNSGHAGAHATRKNKHWQVRYRRIGSFDKNLENFWVYLHKTSTGRIVTNQKIKIYHSLFKTMRFMSAVILMAPPTLLAVQKYFPASSGTSWVTVSVPSPPTVALRTGSSAYSRLQVIRKVWSPRALQLTFSISPVRQDKEFLKLFALFILTV